MARIFISSNKEHVQKVIQINQEAGFTNFSRYDSDEFSLVVFNKKIHPIENFYQHANGDFVALIGTGFYNGVNGSKALQAILSDFDDNIADIQEKTIGNYLLAVYKQGTLYFVTDKYQVIKTYYKQCNKGWSVSNNLSDLLAVDTYLAKESIDYFGLLSETFLVSSFSKRTIVKQLHRLFGFEFLMVNSGVLSVERISHKKNKYDLSGLSRDEIAERYATLIKKYVNIVNDNFGDSIGIHQTGGLDNRTILAAFLNRKIKPQMLYGVGNSCLTNTKKQDLDAVRTFEKNLGLKLKLMDWSHDKSTIKNQEWEDLFNEYGYLYSLYSASHRFFESYETKYEGYPRFMECGYFLENLRLREFTENIDGSISLEDFVDQYLLGGAYGKINDKIVAHYDEYREHIIKELQHQIDIYKIDLSNGITKENFDEVRWIHARHTDSIMVNFLNLYTSSFSIFSQPELHEFPFYVPSEFRANASFQLSTIKALYPKLLNFNFFSHQKYQHFDSDKVILQPIRSRSAKIKALAKGYAEKKLGKTTYDYILNRYRKVRKVGAQAPDSFEKIISDTYSDIISKSSFNKDIKIDATVGDLRLPMKIALILKGIDYQNLKKE